MINKTGHLVTITALVACLAGPLSAGADETDVFEGKLGLGVMVISSGNNLNPRSSKKVIDSLDSAAGRELTVIPLVLPSISYDVGETGGLKLYLNTEPPIDEVGSFAVNLGADALLEGVGVLDVSAFFTPFEEAWENPYATGVARATTATLKYGLKVALNRFLGTGLRVNAVYMNDDVDEDVIGMLQPDLSRDGAVYALNANYSFALSETFELRPRLGIRKGEYDGESNSFIKYKVELEARYRYRRLMLIPRLSYSYKEYDKVNPIFNETGDENGYSISLLANYMAPFGWQDWSAQAIMGYSRGDSNITFYDSEAINGGLFLSYHF